MSEDEVVDDGVTRLVRSPRVQLDAMERSQLKEGTKTERLDVQKLCRT